MKDVDCLVLGLGAMGSAALYHLARLGQRPVGLEQFAIGHALGSSHGHSRVFRVFYRDPLYTELAEAALPLWRDLEAGSGEQLLYLCGFLAYAKPGNSSFEENLAAIQRSDTPFEVLTPAEAVARYPALHIPESRTVASHRELDFLMRRAVSWLICARHRS